MTTRMICFMFAALCSCVDEDEPVCELPDHVYDPSPCDASLDRDGFLMGSSCLPLCADAGAVCMDGERYVTVSAAAEDGCYVDHLCLCQSIR